MNEAKQTGTMPDGKKCPQCDATLPPGALAGLCPACLLKQGATTDSGTPAGAKPFEPPSVAEVARLFPQLEILAFIGQGGMGAVYKARQRTLDRFVALKILPPGAAGDSGFAERFNREARALARLNHPHIVAVHDFGQTGGQPYLVMEFVDGLNLREVERAGRLAPEQALQIVPQICEALQFAHNEGVVHRDIKPENILLDKKGRVKITDFGIAKILGVPAGRVSLTGAKDVMGTPHYMAPEQIEKPQTVDHRADIFSLGVVFYEMLTGELPLGTFQPPSRKVQMDVRLDEVVLHALEKEPERRYQQASQVKTDVETIAQTPDAPLPPPAPAASAGLSSRLEDVCRQVKGPAIGLVVTAILNWITIPVILLVLLFMLYRTDASGGWVLLVPLAALILSSVMLVAGLKMKRLEAYGLAITGSILAILVPPGNLIGLPIGIWALVVLTRREVREAFGKHLPLAAVESPQANRSGGAWKVAAVIAAAVMLLLSLPVMAILLGIGLPALSRQRALHNEQVVRVEEKLGWEIRQRLDEAGWKVEGLSVSVSPGLKRAECRFGKAWKNGLSETPFQAAIRVEPQGKDLWLVTGAGQFQFLRFSVDTSAEMKIPGPGETSWGPVVDAYPNAHPAAVLAAAFGPEKEATLTEFNNSDGQEALDLDTGTVFKQPKDMDQWSEEGLAQWVKENGIDLFVDHGPGGVWGLLTIDDDELKLARVKSDKLGAISQWELVRVLSGGPTDLQAVKKGMMKVYILPKEVEPPMTFAFKTSSGGLGVLQIAGFIEKPRGVKIRYKLTVPAHAR